MEALIIVVLAPFVVGIAIGVVVGTVKGIIDALRRTPTAPEAKPGKPRRKLATEVRHRDKISMDDVVDPDSDEGSIMHLSDEEIADYARQERIPF